LLANLVEILLDTLGVVPRLELEAPLLRPGREMLVQVVAAERLKVLHVGLLQGENRQHPHRKSGHLLPVPSHKGKDRVHYFAHVNLIAQAVDEFDEDDARLLHIESVPDALGSFQLF